MDHIITPTLLTFFMTGNLYINTVEIEHGEKENNGQMFPLPHNVKTLSSSNFVNNTNIANFLYDGKSLHRW